MSAFEITTERTMGDGLPVVKRSWPGTSLRSRAAGVLAFCLETERALLTAAVDPRRCGRALRQVLRSPPGAILVGLLLGCLTGLGFQATAVRSPVQPTGLAVS